jgi:hypothetical protein
MKKRITAALIIAVIALSVADPPAALPYDEGDFQIWHTEDQSVRLREKTKMTLQEEFRYGGNAGQLYYQHYELGIVYAFNEHLDLSANYRHIYSLKKGNFEPEYKPHINATIKWGVPALKFEDRNRLEYRFFNDLPSSLQYRNLITAKFPMKMKNIQLEPYVADEIFAAFEPVALTRNRLYLGLVFNLSKNIKPRIYYLLQSTKSAGKWNDINALGLSLKLEF